jgi:hypothetical protein
MVEIYESGRRDLTGEAQGIVRYTVPSAFSTRVRLACGMGPEKGMTGARMRRFVSLWRDGEGSVIVEAAVVLPVLFIVFLGVFEFSWVDR